MDTVLFTNGGLYFCDVSHTSGSITPANPVDGGVSHWTVFIPAGDAMNWAITAKHTQITDSMGNQVIPHYIIHKSWTGRFLQPMQSLMMLTPQMLVTAQKLGLLVEQR